MCVVMYYPGSRWFHIYSEGEKVVFRIPRDYIQFMNALAIAGAGNPDLAIMAFSVMSTHFHVVAAVRGGDENNARRIMEVAVASYSRYFGHRHERRCPRLMRIECRSLDSTSEKETAVNYVLWNPMHHGVCISAFQYPYSSAGCYFRRCLDSAERFAGEYGVHGRFAEIDEAGSFRGRARRELISRHFVPDTWKISGKRLILPENYICSQEVEKLYFDNFKSFFFGITKGSALDNLSLSALDLSSGRISDIQASCMIDRYAEERGVRSFLHLDQFQLQELSVILKRAGCTRSQIDRCLWL